MADATTAAATMAQDDDDEDICRFCFGDASDGTLISPCACKGDQKWVHVECLQRWQRSVLVTQPTHPAFYSRGARTSHRTPSSPHPHYRIANPPSRFEPIFEKTVPTMGGPVLRVSNASHHYSHRSPVS